MPTISNPVRFGPFELDLHSGELHKNGMKIRLADQPLQILTLLLEHPGQVVTREELRQRLWSSDTFVDFEHGLNAAVKRLREALGDSADTPRFIETLPRHGYRFIAPVDGLGVPVQGGSVVAEARQHKGMVFGIALLILAVGAAAGFAIHRFLSRNTPVIDTRNISIQQLTDHGRVEGFTTVSPDGKMIAYEYREGERSLRVRQVATGSEVTVVPPQSGFFYSATFTPDGSHLYYFLTDPVNPNNRNLYAVPVLGGTSRQILSDSCCEVAFSPDGKRMAYFRFILDKGESQLLIANADGSGENVMLRLPGKEGYISAGPSWSVSSDYIAIVVTRFGNPLGSIRVYTPEGKLVKSLPSDKDIGDIAWLPDSSGLFFVGASQSTGFRRQIWFQPYPNGQPFKISNDLNQYDSLSVPGDGKSFITMQKRPASTIYVGDSPSVLNNKIDWKLTPISHEQATGYNLSWMASGKLLQEQFPDSSYMTAADGSARVRLLEDHPLVYSPRSCGPADMVILAIQSEQNTPNLWRFDVASGELKQLTFVKVAQDSSCTPDGKWMVYLGEWVTDNLEHIWKLSTAGGEPVELARGRMNSFPSVSPDSSSVAYTQVEGQGASAKTKFVVQRLEGGAPVQELDAVSDAGPVVGWTPDGRALTYLHTIGSARHLFMQPLTGGAPVQLTHFDTEPSSIIAWAWSRDGKKIAITRTRFNDTDVVMFSGFR